MELKGKKINFLGDSITEGCGTSSPEYRFTDRIAAQTGAICRNYGIGGTRIARQQTPSAEPRWDLDYCTRAAQMDPDADIIVVFGGTNDYGHGDAPFGDFEDRTPDTFCGAVHALINTLWERYPQAEIVFITPLHRLMEDEPTAENKPILLDYVNALRVILEYYSIPTLDLFACGKMQPAVTCLKEAFMPDGLHPNDDGHVILTRRIIQFLKNL